ncbi:GNAT family N-acetyltransferase [Paraburkholderia sabiae]|uniref:GNAT family N-acetyltransferase n=1 Tax=Paraburkholderia sabiae TaxID=273251 RepID=A0ABU9QH42_9BURK|nr:GNAT family N-acetyltransferase [Paraburkholderia sabiae]WJZ75531.1 GNAT family N-acetyltransferase [Paraburkholderia sabiae]CAD6557211.1 Acetyltransferase [Paraburkholderia sabiae]
MRTLLETLRLRLEPFDETHFAGLLALNSDPVVMQFLGDGSPATAVEVQASIASAKERWERFGFSWWSIIRQDSDEIIGAGCVQHIENEPGNPVEIGWRLKRDHWGHGYATEAARAMIAFAFDVLGVAAIHATTHPSNERSINVMKRLGMRSLGLQPYYGRLVAVYVLER